VLSNTLEGDYYRHFINTIRTDSTLERYIFSLKKYMAYVGAKDVNDLMLLQDNPKLVQSKIIDFIIDLKKQDLSIDAINLYVAAIAKFYTVNDVNLNRRKIGMYMPKRKRRQQDRAYTTEEIAKLLQFCDERLKAVVLLMASTGIRIGALPDLQLRHLQLIKQYRLYKVTVYEGEEEQYYCFTTPECCKAIDDYLDYRKRSGEILTEKSPLIRQQFDANDLEQTKKNPKKMKVKSICNLVRERLARSGLAPVIKQIEGDIKGKRRNSIALTHGFRKFVNTNYVRAKLDAVSKEMLLGHNTGLDRAYYRPTEDEILQEYLKAVDLLTIDESNRLRRENLVLKQKNDRLDSLELQLKAMAEKLGDDYYKT
jgi:integrase